MIPILRICRLRSAITDKINLASYILNFRPRLQKSHFAILKHFEDGKTGMDWSLDLSGPKILKTSLDFMLNPGIIATKNLVWVEEA